MAGIYHPSIKHKQVNRIHHSKMSSVNHGTIQHKEQKQTYYWIWAMSKTTGAAVIYGYRSSEQEARIVADKITNANCEVTPLPTRDEADASRRIRALKLDMTHDIDKSLVRFQHKHL